MNFIGIDLSLNATGIVILNEEEKVIKEEIISSNSKDEIEVRLISIRNAISKLISNSKVIYVEGLSYMSVSSTMAQLAALNFVIRVWLYENNFNFKIVAPTQLKKFVSGKGNSKKSLMIKEVYKKWGYDTEDDNLADAYGLARMALEEKKENM